MNYKCCSSSYLFIPFQFVQFSSCFPIQAIFALFPLSKGGINLTDIEIIRLSNSTISFMFEAVFLIINSPLIQLSFLSFC